MTFFILSKHFQAGIIVFDITETFEELFVYFLEVKHTYFSLKIICVTTDNYKSQSW